jgi:hypothetical protein
MPFAYITREEVQKFAGEQIDPATKRKLTGATRALYVCAYLCLPTSGPEAEKPENERIVTEARVKFARDTGYSERTITRGYRALERAGLIEFTHDGRAGPENVYTREWQKFTLPRAPRGHWRVIVPRSVRKQRQREEADRKRQRARILKALEQADSDGSRIGVALANHMNASPHVDLGHLSEDRQRELKAHAATGEKITPPSGGGTMRDTETRSPPLPPPQRREGGGREAEPRGDEGSRLRREQVSPELSRDERARLRRELSPAVAEERSADWHERIAAAAEKGRENRRRRALGLPDLPDDDPDPH